MKGILLKEKNDCSGRCFGATERVPAGVAAEVVEYLFIEHFAEDRAGRATGRAADEAGDHCTSDGAAQNSGRASQYADRCAGFRTGQRECDAAGGAGDCANGSASLARAMASIDAIGLAFRTRWS
jgi:hypothetical protein